MKIDPTDTCPNCGDDYLIPLQTYLTRHNGSRKLHQCRQCGTVFSETGGTPMQDLKSPISKVASVLRVRSVGLGQ
jgi:rubredoxin